MTFICEGKKLVNNIFTMYIIRITNLKKLKHMSKYNCLTLTIKLKLWQVMDYFQRDINI